LLNVAHLRKTEQLVEQFDLKFSLEEAEPRISDKQLIKLKIKLQHLDVKKRDLLLPDIQLHPASGT